MAEQMTPAELRAAADRIAFPAYPVTPEGRTQWDEDRYASVSAMKRLAAVIEYAESDSHQFGMSDGYAEALRDVLRIARGEKVSDIDDILASAPADVLREVKAAVWARGYGAGYSDRSAPGEPFTRNPYRTREEQDRV